jgi:hypothetical protein
LEWLSRDANECGRTSTIRFAAFRSRTACLADCLRGWGDAWNTAGDAGVPSIPSTKSNANVAHWFEKRPPS